MAKKTQAKLIRTHEVVTKTNAAGERVGMLGKKRTEVLPAEPRRIFMVDCGSSYADKVKVMVSPGQLVNTRKVCKRHREKKSKLIDFLGR